MEDRYEEALKRAKLAIEECGNNVGRIKMIESIFPELKESEDERIRKALIEMVHDTTGDSLWVDYNVHKDDCLAWLEKQSKHANFLDKIQIGDKVTRNEDGMLVNLSQLKRVAKPADVRTIGYWHVEDVEQKPADKVEPKFHKNEWITIKE